MKPGGPRGQQGGLLGLRFGNWSETVSNKMVLVIRNGQLLPGMRFSKPPDHLP